MFFEGDHCVIDAMAEKKHLLDLGSADVSPNILCLGCGGVMLGVEPGGSVTAMYEKGYGDVFDIFGALSTSSPAAAFFMGGNPREGTKMYSEECCTSEFISLKRWKNPLNSDYLNQVFIRKINAKRVLAHRTKLLIGVTNAQTGKQSLIEPKSTPELFRAIHASISVPGWSGREVGLRGRKYIDGASSHPLPVKYLIRRYKPTHVLVFANRTRDVSDSPPYLETAISETLFRGRISPVVRRMTQGRRKRLKESLDWLTNDSGVPVLVAWSSGTIGRFTRNPKKIIEAGQRAEELWLKHLP